MNTAAQRPTFPVTLLLTSIACLTPELTTKHTAASPGPNPSPFKRVQAGCRKALVQQS